MFTLGDVADILDSALDTGISIVDTLAKLSDVADDGNISREKGFDVLNISNTDDFNQGRRHKVNNRLKDNAVENSHAENNRHKHDNNYGIDYNYKELPAKNDTQNVRRTNDVNKRNSMYQQHIASTETSFVNQSLPSNENVSKPSNRAKLQGVPIIEALGDLCSVADNFINEYPKLEENVDNTYDSSKVTPPSEVFKSNDLNQKNHADLEKIINEKVTLILESFQRLDMTVDELSKKIITNDKKHSNEKLEVIKQNEYAAAKLQLHEIKTNFKNQIGNATDKNKGGKPDFQDQSSNKLKIRDERPQQYDSQKRGTYVLDAKPQKLVETVINIDSDADTCKKVYVESNGDLKVARPGTYILDNTMEKSKDSDGGTGQKHYGESDGDVKGTRPSTYVLNNPREKSCKITDHVTDLSPSTTLRPDGFKRSGTYILNSPNQKLNKPQLDLIDYSDQVNKRPESFMRIKDSRKTRPGTYILSTDTETDDSLLKIPLEKPNELTNRHNVRSNFDLNFNEENNLTNQVTRRQSSLSRNFKKERPGTYILDSSSSNTQTENSDFDELSTLGNPFSPSAYNPSKHSQLTSRFGAEPDFTKSKSHLLANKPNLCSQSSSLDNVKTNVGITSDLQANEEDYFKPVPMKQNSPFSMYKRSLSENPTDKSQPVPNIFESRSSSTEFNHTLLGFHSNITDNRENFLTVNQQMESTESGSLKDNRFKLSLQRNSSISKYDRKDQFVIKKFDIDIETPVDNNTSPPKSPEINKVNQMGDGMENVKMSPLKSLSHSNLTDSKNSQLSRLSVLTPLSVSDRSRSQPSLKRHSYQFNEPVMSKLGALQNVMTTSLSKLTNLHKIHRNINFSNELLLDNFSESSSSYTEPFEGSSSPLNFNSLRILKRSVSLQSLSDISYESSPLLFEKDAISKSRNLSTASHETYTLMSPSQSLMFIEKDKSFVFIDENESDTDEIINNLDPSLYSTPVFSKSSCSQSSLDVDDILKSLDDALETPVDSPRDDSVNNLDENVRDDNSNTNNKSETIEDINNEKETVFFDFQNVDIGQNKSANETNRKDKDIDILKQGSILKEAIVNDKSGEAYTSVGTLRKSSSKVESNNKAFLNETFETDKNKNLISQTFILQKETENNLFQAENEHQNKGEEVNVVLRDKTKKYTGDRSGTYVIKKRNRSSIIDENPFEGHDYDNENSENTNRDINKEVWDNEISNEIKNRTFTKVSRKENNDLGLPQTKASFTPEYVDLNKTFSKTNRSSPESTFAKHKKLNKTRSEDKNVKKSKATVTRAKTFCARENSKSNDTQQKYYKDRRKSRKENQPEQTLHKNFLRRKSKGYGLKEKSLESAEEPLSTRLAALRMQLEEKRRQFEEEKQRKQQQWSQERARELQAALHNVNEKENQDPSRQRMTSWVVDFSNDNDDQQDTQGTAGEPKPYISPKEYIRQKQLEQESEKQSPGKGAWFFGLSENETENRKTDIPQNLINNDNSLQESFNMVTEFCHSNKNRDLMSDDDEKESSNELEEEMTEPTHGSHSFNKNLQNSDRHLSNSLSQLKLLTDNTSKLIAQAKDEKPQATQSGDELIDDNRANLLNDTESRRRYDYKGKEVDNASFTKTSNVQEFQRTQYVHEQRPVEYQQPNKIDAHKPSNVPQQEQKQPVSALNIKSGTSYSDMYTSADINNLQRVVPNAVPESSQQGNSRMPENCIEEKGVQSENVLLPQPINGHVTATKIDTLPFLPPSSKLDESSTVLPNDKNQQSTASNVEVRSHQEIHDKPNQVETRPEPKSQYTSKSRYDSSLTQVQLTPNQEETSAGFQIQRPPNQVESSSVLQTNHAQSQVEVTSVQHIQNIPNENLANFEPNNVTPNQQNDVVTDQVVEQSPDLNTTPLIQKAQSRVQSGSESNEKSAAWAVTFDEFESPEMTPEQKKKRDRFLRNRQKRQEAEKAKKEANAEKQKRKEEKVLQEKSKEERLKEEKRLLELELKRRELEHQRELELLEAANRLQQENFSKRIHEITYNMNMEQQRPFIEEQQFFLEAQQRQNTEVLERPMNSYSRQSNSGSRRPQSNIASSPDFPQPGDPNGQFSEYKGPAVYQKPSGKSNRKIMQNAISHCCLCGEVNKEAKKKCLEAIAQSEGIHFLVLFREGLKFRSVYEYNPDTGAVTRIYGIGPKAIIPKNINKYFKYNSGAKEFYSLDTKHLSIQIDGIMIKKELWEKKQGPSKTDSNLKKRIPPSGRAYSHR